MRFVAVMITVFYLSACGTVSGLGKDITGAADWTKDKMSGSKVDLSQKQ